MVWELAHMPFSLEGWFGANPPNSGHPSRGDVSRTGNWAGPRKSPSGWQIPTGPEAPGAGASLPDSVAPGVLCPTSVLQEEEQRPREDWASVKATQQDDGRAEHGTRVLRARLLTRFAGMPAPSSLESVCLPPSLQSPPPSPHPQRQPQLPIAVRVQSFLTNCPTIHSV